MIAFVFPGQGSQYVGMGKKISEEFEEAKKVFSLAGQVLHWDVAKLCFEGPQDRLNQTAYTQPAILTTSLAIYSVFKQVFPMTPQWVAGHSLGEYSALVAAGGLPLEGAISLVAKRGELMQKAVPEGKGAMAAILGLNRQTVESICREISTRGIIAPANYNTLEQIVIAGETQAVAEASKKAVEAGAKKVIPLSVSVPSHCILMEPAVLELRNSIEKTSFHDLKIGLVNNVEARELWWKEEIKASLVRQISTPLLWADSVLFLIEKGVKTFVEIGPGRVLSGLIKRINRQVEVLSVEDPDTLASTVNRLKLIQG
ncbi:MAG: ACP S-malonyltransferase [Nitrospiria bacterium]